MASLAISHEVPRGEYVIAQCLDGEYYHILECTVDLAYAFFAQAKLNQLRLNGQEGFVIINPDDLESGYWGFRGNIPEDEPEDDEEPDYDVG